MKKQVLGLLVLVFMINLVLGVSVCIDKDKPTWPEDSSLDLSIVDNNDIQLEWTPAEDKPECSGIGYYEIYRSFDRGNLELIGNSDDTDFLDKDLDYGNYEYMIHAYDKVDQKESNISLLNSIALEEDTDDSGESGGGTSSGSSISSFWKCGNWSECEDGTQERICKDIRGYKNEKTETRDCDLESETSGTTDNQEETEINQNDEGTPDSETSGRGITGAFIDVVNTPDVKAGISLAITSLLLIGLLVIAVKRYQ